MRILACLDDSSLAAHVLGSAVKIAARVGGKVLVVRVVEPPVGLQPEVLIYSFATLVENMRKNAEEDLGKLTQAVPAALLEKVLVEAGPATPTIIDIARKERVDMMVAGAHGYSPLARILGTTAARLANHAPCSLLLVRQGKDTLDRIVVALDGAPAMPRVVEMAVALGRATHARLTLLRAVTVPAMLPAAALKTTPLELEALLKKDAQEYLDKIKGEIREEVAVDTKVETASPASCICDIANREGADLVVIGAHTYGVVEELLGTIAAKVANHATTSVLVVR